MKNNYTLSKYEKRLAEIPAPGGNGCHSALLAVANLGVIAGLKPKKIFDDIRQNIVPGTRRVSDGEIFDAVKKALNDHSSKHYDLLIPKPKTVVRNGKITLFKIISQAKYYDEADLWEFSPVRLLEEP